MHNPIQEAVQQLRQAADRLQALQAGLNVPVGDGCTLQEAKNRLRAAGCRFLSVNLVADCHEDGSDEVTWRVWDGKQHFKGPTLGDAVNAVLLSLRPAPAQPLAAVDAVLAAAEPLAF